MKNLNALTLRVRSAAAVLSFGLLLTPGVHAQTPPVKKPAPTPAPVKPATAPKPAPSPAGATHPTAAPAGGAAAQHGTSPAGRATTTTSHGSGVTTGNAGTTTTNHGSGVTTGNTSATTTNHGSGAGAAGNAGAGGGGTNNTQGRGASNNGTVGNAKNGTENRGGSRPPMVNDRAASRGGSPGHPEPVHETSAREIRHDGPMAGHQAPPGTHEVRTERGVVRTGPDGRVRDTYLHGTDIHHGLYGGSRVGMDRPGGGRAYYERGRSPYLGHPFRAHGAEFNRRTYYDHGRAYERFYRPYGYHGYALDVYVPGRYYAPTFYSWAYQPWGPRVTYSWGFANAPWYGAYGGYFQPYPVYATPSLWLTDYMISQSLAAGYAAQQETGNAPAVYSGQPLSPEVKQQIAQEVQNTISIENYEAQNNAKQQVPDPDTSGIGHLLSDGHPHVFIADKEVDVTQVNGPECAVTDGDVIQVVPPGPSDKDTTANATVLSSKGGRECPVQSMVAVGLDDLSEMNNHLRETIDRGLEELQKKQGTGGLPKVPDSAKGPVTNSVVAENDPPPEPAGSKELENLAAQSLKDEGELVKEAQVGAAPGADMAAPPTETVSLDVGQSLEQVQAALGTPTRKVAAGKSTLYYFGETKVTMVGGKVTKIE